MRLSERATVLCLIVATVLERNELIVRPGDVNVLQLLGIESIDSFDLRDDLVA